MTKIFFSTLESSLKSMEAVKSDERFFEGLLTVQMKDKQGEVTIVDELYKVLPVWMDRGAPISDTHSNRIIGKGINYSKTTIKNSSGDELPAIKITGKIFKDYQLDNLIWDKIKNKEYKGLSFGGATKSARTPFRMKDGSMAYALSDLEHYEVAVCKDPAVPMALITDFNPIAKAHHNGEEIGDGKMKMQCTSMGCYVEKDSLVKIEDNNDEDTKVTVLDEWKHEAHPDKDNDDETNKADEDKPLNKPMRDDGDKKFKVYVKDPKTGKTVTVRFGDPNMEIKRDDPERRASFRARHDCENAKDITTPQYWSCKMWEKETSVTDHTNKADLNESQTFEEKVQALMREGKSRESAEKIVGSFVKKDDIDKGAAGKGELFTPIRPSKQDIDDFDEDGNPIKKDLEPTRDFKGTGKVLHRVATNNANAVRAAGNRSVNESKVTQEGDTAVVHKPRSRKFKPDRSFKDDQEEFGDYYDTQNQVLRSDGDGGMDAGTVNTTDNFNAVHQNKDKEKKKKKTKKDKDDEQDKDWSNADGDNSKVYNQNQANGGYYATKGDDDESVSPAKDMEFEGKADTTLNQTGGVRNDVANMNRQNGMEEEESSTIARVRTTQPENKFVNASYDKTVNTKVLDIIKASLEKHEKILKLKSLNNHMKVSQFQRQSTSARIGSMDHMRGTNNKQKIKLREAASTTTGNEPPMNVNDPNKIDARKPAPRRRTN